MVRNYSGEPLGWQLQSYIALEEKQQSSDREQFPHDAKRPLHVQTFPDIKNTSCSLALIAYLEALQQLHVQDF